MLKIYHLRQYLKFVTKTYGGITMAMGLFVPFGFDIHHLIEAEFPWLICWCILLKFEDITGINPEEDKEEQEEDEE